VKAAAWLDPGASSMDKGVKWRSTQWFPCAKPKGEMGVWSTVLGGGRREWGEPGGVGATRGGGERLGGRQDTQPVGAVGMVCNKGRRSLDAWAVVGRPAWAWPVEQCPFLFI
jgi:hypothetical protein